MDKVIGLGYRLCVGLEQFPQLLRSPTPHTNLKGSGCVAGHGLHQRLGQVKKLVNRARVEQKPSLH